MSIIAMISLLNVDRKGVTLRGVLHDVGDSKSHIVICLAGFERCASTETKFVLMSQSLAQEGISSVRLDRAGLGLSDGVFAQTSVDGLVDQLSAVINALGHLGYTHISLLGHSLAGCVMLEYVKNHRDGLEKLVFLAPSFNQVKLLAYRYVKNRYGKATYEIRFDDVLKADFEDYCLHDQEVKSHIIGSQYFLDNKEKDYADDLIVDTSWMHVHGDNDDVVPLESVNMEFFHQIVVGGGDHELEKSSMSGQWMGKVVRFFSD